jgi:effector-binding domain-containing protein
MSIETPELMSIEARPAAVVPVVTPRSEIRAAMTAAITELMTALESQGIAPAGPMFAHHHRISPREFDFEVGFPVEAPLEPTGRVKSGEMPGGRMAVAVMPGGYEGLGDAWREFEAWLTRQDFGRRGGFCEVYVTGPETSADPEDWRTQLRVPLVE